MATDFKHLVRVANVDLDGSKPLLHALKKIRGVSFSFANAVCNSLEFDKNQQTGLLTKEQVKKLEDEIRNPSFPTWLLNRRKDTETAKDKHLIEAGLKLQGEFDIKRLQRIKSYRGLRHAQGLPVRGQRTKGHFRKGKTVGVQRKGIKMAAKSPKEKETKAEKK